MHKLVATEAIRLILGILEETSFAYDCSTASEFHRTAAEIFAREGFEVRQEVTVRDRGDGRSGRLDLVLDDEFAVEIDWITPRRKSKAKIRSWGGPGVIYCRESGAHWWTT